MAWKSPRQLLVLLIESVSKGGNVSYNEELAGSEICLLLPVERPNIEIPVIELFLTEPPPTELPP